MPFGIEVMGRVRELGSARRRRRDLARLGWVRPVLDFAHMHATSDGAFTSVEPFAEALAKADAVLEPGAPFHIHFSDIQFANRNETKHLPYGEGTLRAEPLREALARFERPATVISESPDEESTAGDPRDPRARRITWARHKLLETPAEKVPHEFAQDGERLLQADRRDPRRRTSG